MTNHPGSAFFIVGTGRCGTNLLRNLLQVHPDVWIARETHWLPILFHFYGLQEISAQQFLHVIQSVYMAKGRTAFERMMMNHLDPEMFKRKLLERLSSSPHATIREFMLAYYTLLAERNQASIWGDKTPDYGLCMGIIQTIWPEAKFLHIVRDGRDVALSMSKVLSFRYLVAWEINHWFGIAYQKQYAQKKTLTESFLPVERFYELWRSRLLRTRDEARRLQGDCYREIHYEALLHHAPRILKDISQFLNLPDGGNWIQEAAALIKYDPVGKNLDNPEYLMLTDRYAADLNALGFKP